MDGEVFQLVNDNLEKRTDIEYWDTLSFTKMAIS